MKKSILKQAVRNTVICFANVKFRHHQGVPPLKALFRKKEQTEVQFCRLAAGAVGTDPME
eukprot:2911368-Amphidinium_carterae.1